PHLRRPRAARWVLERAAGGDRRGEQRGFALLLRAHHQGDVPRRSRGRAAAGGAGGVHWPARRPGGARPRPRDLLGAIGPVGGRCLWQRKFVVTIYFWKDLPSESRRRVKIGTFSGEADRWTALFSVLSGGERIGIAVR